MKKKLTKKRLFYLIISAISCLLLGALSVVVGFLLDPYGKKPYIVLPAVALFIVFWSLCVLVLFKILPYEMAYNRKKLKQKTFKNKVSLHNEEELKESVINNSKKLIRRR